MPISEAYGIGLGNARAAPKVLPHITSIIRDAKQNDHTRLPIVWSMKPREPRLLLTDRQWSTLDHLWRSSISVEETDEAATGDLARELQELSGLGLVRRTPSRWRLTPRGAHCIAQRRCFVRPEDQAPGRGAIAGPLVLGGIMAGVAIAAACS